MQEERIIRYPSLFARSAAGGWLYRMMPAGRIPLRATICRGAVDPAGGTRWVSRTPCPTGAHARCPSDDKSATIRHPVPNLCPTMPKKRPGLIRASFLTH